MPSNVTVNVGRIPVVPAHSRPGLDSDVISALQGLDRLMKDMRENLTCFPSSDEEASVLQSLVYLSVLLDICLADIVMSAMISNDVAVRMKLRLLLEYSAKGYYYDIHPEYALFMVAIQRLRDMIGKAKNSGGSKAEI